MALLLPGHIFLMFHQFFLLIGVVQWIYALPLYFLARRRSTQLGQGVPLGVAITFLANGLCIGSSALGADWANWIFAKFF